MHRLGGTCAPTARHMDVHMFTHLQKPAGTHTEYWVARGSLLPGFFAGAIYFRIRVHYFCWSRCSLAQLPTGCVFLQRVENPGSTNTRVTFWEILCKTISKSDFIVLYETLQKRNMVTHRTKKSIFNCSYLFLIL